MKLNRRQKICYPTFGLFPEYQKKKKPVFNWRLWLGIFLGVLITAGIGYLALFSPYFKIKEIAVAGTQIIDKEKIVFLVQRELNKKIFRFVPLDSILIFSSGEAEKRISENFAEAATINIQKIWPGGLEIKISERQSAAVWCQSAAVSSPLSPEAATSTPSDFVKELPEASQCFFVDDNGLIYRSSPQISGSIMPMIYGAAGVTGALRQEVLASSTISFARQIKTDLEKRGLEVNVFLENESRKELEAVVAPGWRIYFNLERPASNQIQIIDALLAGDLKDKQGSLKYIDLRIPGRAYYK